MSQPVDVEGRRSIFRVIVAVTVLAASFFSIYNWVVGLKGYALTELAVACLWGGIWRIAGKTPNLNVLYRAKRRSEPVTVVYIDIDDFKSVNDQYGHERGDRVLVAVAKAIKSVTRLEDYAFRYGGDEFCVVFSNCTEQQARTIYATRIAEEIQKYEQGLSLSLGYIQADAGSHLSPEELIRRSDQRMYSAKRAEKSRLDGALGCEPIRPV